MQVVSPTIYRPSGALGKSWLVTPLAILVAVPILSVLYGYIDIYCPVVGYISILFMVGYAFGLIATVGVSGRRSKCRNPLFMTSMGLLAGLLGLYLSWVAFECALVNRSQTEYHLSLLNLSLKPASIWKIARNIDADGWYSIHEMTPKGIVLWGMWLVEAAVIVGAPMIGAALALRDEVFCEMCNRWCKITKGLIRFAPAPDPSTLKTLAAGSVHVLDPLQPVTAQANPHLRIDIWQCPRCQATTAFKARSVSWVHKKDGKPEVKEQDLTKVILLDQDSFSRLQDLSKKKVPEEIIAAPMKAPAPVA